MPRRAAAGYDGRHVPGASAALLGDPARRRQPGGGDPDVGRQSRPARRRVFRLLHRDRCLSCDPPADQQRRLAAHADRLGPGHRQPPLQRPARDAPGRRARSRPGLLGVGERHRLEPGVHRPHRHRIGLPEWPAAARPETMARQSWRLAQSSRSPHYWSSGRRSPSQSPRPAPRSTSRTHSPCSPMPGSGSSSRSRSCSTPPCSASSWPRSSGWERAIGAPSPSNACNTAGWWLRSGWSRSRPGPGRPTSSG